MTCRTLRRALRSLSLTSLARLLALSACASPLAAQETTAAAIGLGGIDNLLRRVESINIYCGGSIGRPTERPSTTARLPWGSTTTWPATSISPSRAPTCEWSSTA
jgi:hypothetical protein